MHKRMPFPADEHVNLPREGTAVGEGQAFLETVGGELKDAAGSTIYLQPVTSFSEEWYDVAVVHDRPVEPADRAILDHLWQARADAEGRFEFEGIPAGASFVGASISWGAPKTDFLGGWYVATTGSVVGERIELADGEAVSLVLTRDHAEAAAMEAYARKANREERQVGAPGGGSAPYKTSQAE